MRIPQSPVRNDALVRIFGLLSVVGSGLKALAVQAAFIWELSGPSFYEAALGLFRRTDVASLKHTADSVTRGVAACRSGPGTVL